MPEPSQTPQPRPPPREYLLTVRREAEGLTAHWDQGNPFPLPLPLDKRDLDELAWYLERYCEFPGAGDRARAAALERRLTDWGLALWQALFPGGEQNAVYAGIRDHLHQAGPEPRRVLLTLASDQPDFLIRPWEMLRDPRGPLALRGLTLRRRLLRRDEGPAPVPASLPLRLLLIVSRPEDTGFIDPRTSTRPVLAALAGLARCDPPRVVIDFCEPPTFAALGDRLAAARRAGAPYHLVHFDGHGQYYPLTGVGALCFERPDRKTDLIEGPRLADLLSRLQVPLVLLEACRGAQVSDRPVFGALAPALLQGGVGSVIAFSHSVHVAAATLACERLYQGLVAGLTIGESLDEARAALLTNRARWLTPGPDPETVDLQDWIIPQLYQGGADPALVPPPGSAAPPCGESPRDDLALPGFPPAPRYRFQGRARELLDLERILQHHSGVLLHAGGGMGKTALAREAAHWWLRTGRFDRALFHSFEQGAGAEAVVRLLGESLGGDGFAALGPDQQWAQAVRLFRGHRVLLVWDNFESMLPSFARPDPDAPVGSAARTDSREDPASAAGADHGSGGLGAGGPVGSAVRTESREDPASAARTESGSGGLGAGGGPHSGPYSAGNGPHSGPYGAGTGPHGGPDASDTAARADLERLYRELTDGDTAPRHGGRLLVTCRPRETGLAGIRELRLRGLARPDALHLLRGIVERKEIDLERPGWERLEIEELLDRLEDHPLSIELIAPHLQDLRPRTIREELAGRLDQFQDQSRAEGRNRSLLASLDFSRRHLSPAAREALPWLGWFEGGMFERFFLNFSQVPEAHWSGLRAELTATALLRVEDLPQFNTPYLKLHPTLAEAAAPATGDAELAGRFIDCYLGVGGMVDGMLRGSEPAGGMAIMGLEQSNLRRAMTLAFKGGRHREGGALADTLRGYLERAGRLRERDRLTAWVRGQMPLDRLDGATCAAIRQQAWTLFTQGQAREALEAVQDLERRLEAGGLEDGDPPFQLAIARNYRGRILLNAGRPDLALEPLGQSIAAWRAFGDGQRANLSATLGELANALSALGRYDQALAVADEALAIDRPLGNHHAVAVDLGRTAAILRAAGCHGEAEARYGEALGAAGRVGDLELQGAFLQHLGGLQRQMGRAAESTDTLRRALRSFQQSSNRGGEMQTCDLLGSAEMDLGRLDPAEAWYRKALDLARGLGDQRQTGITRQNLGILYQVRAAALPETAAAAPERDRLLAAAVTEIEASLAIWQAMGNRLGAASSHAQLGILHRLRGDLDRAETQAHQALAIRESLDHLDAWKDYANLAEIARARGDTSAAADWQSKADAKRAEAKRRAAGPAADAGDPAAAPDRRLMEALLALAQSVHQARTQHRAPEPDTAEALAQLAGLPDPLGAFGRFLQALARGEDPPPPPGLPEPLAQVAAALLEALAGAPP